MSDTRTSVTLATYESTGANNNDMSNSRDDAYDELPESPRDPRTSEWVKSSQAAIDKGAAVHQKMETGAVKNDIADAKVRLDLFPPSALYGISTVFTYGAAKYDDWNWAKGLPYSRLYGALQRHLLLWFMGQDSDPETGFSHLWHAGCNIAMLIHTEQLARGTSRDLYQHLDDRPKQFHSLDMQEQWQYILKKSQSYQEVLAKASKSQQ
jgi:hypothetical protein